MSSIEDQLAKLDEGDEASKKKRADLEKQLKTEQKKAKKKR